MKAVKDETHEKILIYFGSHKNEEFSIIIHDDIV
jgi:hypothetical protein